MTHEPPKLEGTHDGLNATHGSGSAFRNYPSLLINESCGFVIVHALTP